MRIPPPAALNFGAGLFAGAGINLLTSIAGADAAGGAWKAQLVADSLLWVALAASVTWTAGLFEQAVRRADRYIKDDTPPDAQDEMLRYELSQVRRQIRCSWVLSAVCLVAAVLLVPGLIR